MTTLECKQCGYVNEGERVYCHNCGTRLDRTLIANEGKQPLKKTTFTPRRQRPRLNALVPMWEILKFALSALVCAALIQIARPPEGCPVGTSSGKSPHIASMLQGIIASPMPQRLVLEEEQINVYLDDVLKGTYKGMLADYFHFEGSYVNLEEQFCRFTMQESFFGWPLYFGAAYRVDLSGGNLRGVCIGGNAGRFHLPAPIASRCGFVFRKLWAALDQEAQLLGKLKSIELHKHKAVLTSKGALRN